MLRRSSRLLMKATHNTSKPSNVALSRTFSSKDFIVEHDDDKQLFYIKLNEGVAFIQYEKDDSLLDLQETEVPQSVQGKGIGQILAKAAFDHVVKNNLKMRLTCTFLQSYFQKNALPEYTSRIVE